MVSLDKIYKRTIPIEGYAINVRVARLTFEQAEAHRRNMVALRQKNQRQKYELRELNTLTPDELARLQKTHGEESLEVDAMLRAAIEAYVTVDPNQISAGGREVTTGKDVMDLFGYDTDLVLLLMLAIEEGGKVSATAGKTSGSPSDSTRSSGALDASGPAVDGPRPEGIVPSAAPEATTASAAATGVMDGPSSGSTATLN
jgi:hypothetical protein